MRLRQLFELTRPQFRDDAAELLRRSGWKQYGDTGAYARVFGRTDRPYVIKLFKSDDTGYLRFLSLIMQYNNPHFPVLRGRPIQVTQEYWAVQLEKLEPTEGSNKQLAEHARTYISNYQWLRDHEYEEYQVARGQMNPTPHYEPPAAVLRRRNYGTVTAFRQKMAPFEHHYPELAEALRMIIHHVIPKGEFDDLHEDNFMQRGGATLVVIDPMAFSGSKEFSLPPYRSKPQQELPFSGDLGTNYDYHTLSHKLPLNPQGYQPKHPVIPGIDIDTEN